MAAGAGGLLASAQHRVAGLENRMVAVARCAPRNSHLRKQLAMRALVEQLGIHSMALSTNVYDRSYARGHRAMVAVAIIAGGRGQIALLRDHLPVHALPVLIELIGGDLVRRHIFLVGMA